MEKRYSDLTELKLFTSKIDKEMTMILQSLQWNRSKLIEEAVKETCRYDANHKIPPDKREIHEQECFLSCQGYSKEDELLPDPLDPNANTLVKLNTNDISQIIVNTKKSDPLFKNGAQTTEPCTLERLQATYSADERRAIHDAVVEAVPFCHDLTDLALPSTSGDDPTVTRDKSRAEILAELRDMKRRRTKYRVAAKTRNYSDVLRDVIKTQMELYTEVEAETEIKIEPIEVENDSGHASEHMYSNIHNKTTDKDRMDRSAYQKYNTYKRETCIEDRQNKETSRYCLYEDEPNTYNDRRHNVYNTNVHKQEFHRRDESNDKYQTKNNREHRNDDHYRSKYNKKEDGESPRNERYDRKHNSDNVNNSETRIAGHYRSKYNKKEDGERPRNERYDRKHNSDNVNNSETRNDGHYRSKYNIEERDRDDRKYNADNVRDKYDKYQNKASSSKDYINMHKSRDDKYKEKYKADCREIKEGKNTRYYDERTNNEDETKRMKYS